MRLTPHGDFTLGDLVFDGRWACHACHGEFSFEEWQRPGWPDFELFFDTPDYCPACEVAMKASLIRS